MKNILLFFSFYYKTTVNYFIFAPEHLNLIFKKTLITYFNNLKK